MNADNEKLYSYSHLFGITVVYSGCAVGVYAIIFYLAEQLGNWEIYVGIICVSFFLSLLFSILGQQISGVAGIGKCIFLTSGLSSILFDRSFATWGYAFIELELDFSYLLFFLLFIGLAWYYDDIWAFLTQAEIPFKRIISVVGVVGIALAMLLVLFVYSSLISGFFDRHPWVMTFISIVATLLGGILIGRRTKKS